MKFPFEFCALRYLLQWQRKETSLHVWMKKETPELAHIRKALRYFQVARNFKGLKLDERAEQVRGALLDVRGRSSLSAEQKVIALARSFEEANFQHNMSASSKLLWLSTRRPFIIYDSRALVALQNEYALDARKLDYEAYCLSWRAAYRKSKQDVLRAVNELPKIRSFLPGDTPPDSKLLALVNKPWFRERVFDIYLWELGGDA